MTNRLLIGNALTGTMVMSGKLEKELSYEEERQIAQKKQYLFAKKKTQSVDDHGRASDGDQRCSRALISGVQNLYVFLKALYYQAMEHSIKHGEAQLNREPRWSMG